MKKIYILLGMTFAVTTIWSQKTWDGGAGTSNWQTANNWNPNGVPTATDVVDLSNGSSLSITNINNGATIARLIINSGTVTLAGFSGPTTLNIAGDGTATDDLIIANGATFVHNGALETLTMGVDATADISGTYTSSGAFNISNTGVLVTVSSTGVFDNRVSTITGATSTKLVFIGGRYMHGVNGGVVPDATWNTGSIAEIVGMTTNCPTGLNQVFANVLFTSNISGGNVTLPTDLTCTEDFTFNCIGTTDLNIVNTAANVTVNVGRDFFMLAGNFAIVSDDGTGTLNVARNFSLEGGVFTVKEEDGVAAFNVTGNFSQSGGTLIHRSDNTGVAPVVHVTGDFEISGGTYNISSIAATATLEVGGNFTLSGGVLTETSTSSGTVFFTGTGTQVFTKSAAPGTIVGTVHFTVNSGASVNFGTSILNESAGTFTLSSGARVITSNANGLTAGTGSIQIARVLNSGADYEFRGASTGVFTTTASPQIRNLIINNSGGDVALAQPMTVNGLLSLSNGLLNTSSANLLTVSATGGQPVTYSTTSFVNGPLAKEGTSAFLFPIGKSGAGYRLLGISAPAVGSTFQAEFQRAASPTGIFTGNIKQVSFCEHWDLTRNAGVDGVSVTISWENNSSCNANSYVTELATLRVGHLVAGTWMNEGQQSITGTVAAGTITSNIISTFSQFSLASVSGVQNPLPVLFYNVRGFEKNSGIQLEWSNLTEREVSYYVFERSVDGTNYTELSRQLPKSNLNERADYTAFDASPLTGANFYRVKVLEANGKVIYSKVIRMERGVNARFNFYPNPVSGGQFTISMTGIRQGKYDVRVTNSAGQQIFQERISAQSGSLTQTFDLPTATKAGIYTLVVSGDGYHQSKLFIIR